MGWFSKKNVLPEHIRQNIREIIIEYGINPDDVMYNIYRGRPYTETNDEICVVGASAPGEDAFAFAAVISTNSTLSRRIPWKVALRDKNLAHSQGIARITLYDRICNIAKEEEETTSALKSSLPVDQKSNIGDTDRKKIIEAMEAWRDGELTDAEWAEAVTKPLYLAVRDFSASWCNGDVEDDIAASRILLAAKIILGNRDDLIK